MEDYIAGRHPVLEALRSGRTVNKIWIAEQAQPSLIQAVAVEAKKLGLIVSMVDKRKLDQMLPDVRHQGVIAQVAVTDYMELDQLLRDGTRKSGDTALFIILDGIEDPHNLGSILRTADGAGADGVIIPKRRSASLNATVAKTSAGAVEYVPVARVTNLSRAIEQMKQSGIWIVGAEGTAPQDIYDLDLTMPLGLVIGNEGKGISRIIKEKCDFLAKLPMNGRINSLNASVAASLFMYEVVRQRRKPMM